MGKCKKSFSHLARLNFTRAPWAWKAAKVKKSTQPFVFRKMADYRERWSSCGDSLTKVPFVYLPKATGTLQGHICSLPSDLSRQNSDQTWVKYPFPLKVKCPPSLWKPLLSVNRPQGRHSLTFCSNTAASPCTSSYSALPPPCNVRHYNVVFLFPSAECHRFYLPVTSVLSLGLDPDLLNCLLLNGPSWCFREESFLSFLLFCWLI